MGVPKFFRYISERYPCLSELVRERNLVEFDNLYLDMNGIIHNCSHPDDGNVHFRMTEEDMLRDIFKYIERLIFIIKPKKLLFMAIDGVAPRAKMNQQRSRRFRTAKEIENDIKKATERGEKLPDEEHFDSNCITPGTEFMERLHHALKYFVKSKISSDPLWQKCRVVLSGHDSPGEGEHKVMDYIRYLKSKPDYDTNTRHCLYGLDADLIILGLCTHEANFSLLREEVKFGRKVKRVSQEEVRFYLLHLGLLKEYLELEFVALKNERGYDSDKLIDDWILMGLLVGNDFIPHIPNLHINSNALPILYKTYINIYPELGGNINENGELNMERLEKFFGELAKSEFELFKENYADLKYFEAKLSKNGIDEAFDIDIEEVKNCNADLDDLTKLIQESEMIMDDDDDFEDEESHIADEFHTYKRNYYIKKLKYDEMTPEVLSEQSKGYVTALQWVLYYYYKGVKSWSWFFPHYYAPFVSDLKNFKDFKVEFKLGKPYFPYEQLLAVLPSASKKLLPEAFHNLMTENDSPLINYFPTEFETDLNGKKQEWEAVVLIPFIEETALMEAMKPCLKDLSPSEAQRNTHGPMMQFDYSDVDQGEYPGMLDFRPLHKVFCTETKVWREEILISDKELLATQKKKSGPKLYVAGFPTMKFLQYTGDLRNCRVRVFEQPSRNESMLLKPVIRDDFNDVNFLASKYLNKTVYIGWPHLTKARVLAVSNKNQHIDANGVQLADERLYHLHVRTIKDHLINRMGIDVENMAVLVHVQTLLGSKYAYASNGKFTLTETYSSVEMAYPAAALVTDIEEYIPDYQPHKKIEEIFPVGSSIFFIGSPYYGSEGKVLDPLLVYECGRLKVSITALPEPDLSEARTLQKTHSAEYYSTQQVACFTGLHYGNITRITGSVLVIQGARRPDVPENIRKINIGLRLKSPKLQEQVAGYMKKERNAWLYSMKAVKLIMDYYVAYPSVFEVLSSNEQSADLYFESDLFNEIEGENTAEGIANWIKKQEFYQCEHVPIGSSNLEAEAISSVLEATEKIKKLPVKNIKLQVKPHLLLNSEIGLPALCKQTKNLRLFDRIVVVKPSYGVPLGSRGTIVAIHPFMDLNPVRMENVKSIDNSYQVLFDMDLPSGKGIYGLAQGRIAKIPEHAMLLIFNSDPKETSNPQSLPANSSNLQPRMNEYFKENKTEQPQIERKPIIQRRDEDKNFWFPAESQKPKPFVPNAAPTATPDRVQNKSFPSYNNKAHFQNEGPVKSPRTFPVAALPNVHNVVHQLPNNRQPETEKQIGINTSEGFLNNFVVKANKSIGAHEPEQPIANNATEPQGFLNNFIVNANKSIGAHEPEQPIVNNTSEPLGFLNNFIAKANKNIATQEQSNNSEKILKSCLGLAYDKQPLMKGSFPQPPKPPSNWRTDALRNTNPNASTSHSNKNNFVKYNQQSNMNTANIPLQFYGQNISPLAPQQQMPYVNDNFYSPSNLNQKGAFRPTQPAVFIPLQVQRGGKQPTTAGNMRTHRETAQVVPDSYQPTREELPVQSQREPGNPSTKRRARVPKLAAKFDNV